MTLRLTEMKVVAATGGLLGVDMVTTLDSSDVTLCYILSCSMSHIMSACRTRRRQSA